MTDFYIPKSCTLSVFGQTQRFIRGIHPVPDIFANSHDANKAGIKPVEEMTDQEYVMLGLETPTAKAAREEAAKTTNSEAREPKVISFDASKVAEKTVSEPDVKSDKSR